MILTLIFALYFYGAGIFTGFAVCSEEGFDWHEALIVALWPAVMILAIAELVYETWSER